MDKISELYLILLKSPDMLKVYKDIQKEYQQLGMLHESKAFEHLIKEKFNEPNVTYFDAK